MNKAQLALALGLGISACNMDAGKTDQGDVFTDTGLESTDTGFDFEEEEQDEETPEEDVPTVSAQVLAYTQACFGKSNGIQGAACPLDSDWNECGQSVSDNSVIMETAIQDMLQRNLESDGTITFWGIQTDPYGAWERSFGFSDQVSCEDVEAAHVSDPEALYLPLQEGTEVMDCSTWGLNLDEAASPYMEWVRNRFSVVDSEGEYQSYADNFLVDGEVFSYTDFVIVNGANFYAGEYETATTRAHIAHLGAQYISTASMLRDYDEYSIAGSANSWCVELPVRD